MSPYRASDIGGEAPGAREQRVRLFVALELPRQAREGLAQWQALALQGLNGVRAIGPADLHLTLCFLGWRYEREVDSIRDACTCLAAYAAPELRVRQVVCLPPRRARVIAVELDDIGGALGRAQVMLSEVLEAGGWYRSDKRPYLAHVTLARVGRGAYAPPRPLPDPPDLTFHATQVTLYRSHLERSSGPTYEPLGSVQLTVSRKP